MINSQRLKSLKKIKIINNLFLNSYIPSHLSKNFIAVADFESKFAEQVAQDTPDLEFNSNVDFQEFDERLNGHRKQIIPWLNSVRSLKGLRILEIGCGSGSSAIALAEQGALVTAIDVDPTLLSIAKIRGKVYELAIKFQLLNALDVDQAFANENFDLVIFMASLEHMTIDERIQSMKRSYDLLAKGALWCIVGTPNRLHFMDSHTSHLPFFHWLPDGIAIRYAQNSSREVYKQHLSEIDDEQEKMVQFYRWGRGVSFHEIEMALSPLSELKVVSNKALFMRKKNWFYYIGSRFSSNYKFETFLNKLYPTIHRGFFQPYLDMIFEKQ